MMNLARKQSEPVGKAKGSSKKPVKTNNAAFGNIAQQADEYKTSRDHIWSDVIRHEQLVDKQWKETWLKQGQDEGIARLNSFKTTLQDNIASDLGTIEGSRELFTPFYQAKPSSHIPLRASEIIGWRSSDPANLLDFFRTTYLPGKKRFVAEQYGYYRCMKYLENVNETMLDMKPKQPPDGEEEKKTGVPVAAQLPVKVVRPPVKRIIC